MADESCRPVSGAEVAGELADFGAELVAVKYRREHPGCTDEEVHAAVRAWWTDRRGAPDGDVAGTVRRR